MVQSCLLNGGMRYGANPSWRATTTEAMALRRLLPNGKFKIVARGARQEAAPNNSERRANCYPESYPKEKPEAMRSGFFVLSA